MKILKKLLNNQKIIFNFSKLKFWRLFLVSSFYAFGIILFVSSIGFGILNKISDPLKFSNQNSLIIEVLPKNNSEKTEAKINIIKGILDNKEYIKKYEFVDKEELIKLTENFSSQFKELSKTNILPIIIVAEVDQINNKKLNDLRATLSQKVDDTFVDSEYEIISRVISPLNTAKYFSSITPFITILIIAGILFLIIYSIIYSNYNTMITLVLLGLSRNDLSKEFAIWIFINAIKASILTLGSSLVVILIMLLKEGIPAPLSSFSFFFLMTLLLPILSGIISYIFVNTIIKKFFT